MKIELREITKDNFESVGELYIPDEQQEHLSRNIWSIAEAKYYDNHRARAIYCNDEVVGFIMWVHVTDVISSIWRFMVAHEHQNKGIGRLALECAIEEMKERESIEKIEICYGPDNTIPKNLYFSFGFIEVGMSNCGSEAYAQIDVSKAG